MGSVMKTEFQGLSKFNPNKWPNANYLKFERITQEAEKDERLKQTIFLNLSQGRIIKSHFKLQKCYCRYKSNLW